MAVHFLFCFHSYLFHYICHDRIIYLCITDDVSIMGYCFWKICFWTVCFRNIQKRCFFFLCLIFLDLSRIMVINCNQEATLWLTSFKSLFDFFLNNVLYKFNFSLFKDFERSRAFSFLGEVKKRFQTTYGSRAQTALPYAMNSEFSSALAAQMVSGGKWGRGNLQVFTRVPFFFLALSDFISLFRNTTQTPEDQTVFQKVRFKWMTSKASWSAT